MNRLTGIALAALLLAGCGKAPISENEAADIAALSQDAGMHHRAFTDAVLELSGKDECSAEAMSRNGAFSKVTGEYYYFIYCGEPPERGNRWYFNPRTDVLTQFKAQL